MKRLLCILTIPLLLNVSLSADWNLVRLPAPSNPEPLESSGFQLFHRAGDFWIGSLPEDALLPIGSQILTEYDPQGGDIFRLLLSSPSEVNGLIGRVSMLYQDEDEAIIQATLEQLQTLPEIRAEWVRITLTPKPMGYSGGVLPSTDDFSPFVEEMVQQVSQQQYTEYIQTLEDFVTRNTYTINFDNAAAWILAQFQSFGLNAYFDEFLVGGQIKVSVIGELVGQTYPDSVFFITGHYDATAGQPWTPEPIAPGANDNASGATCVLECARVLSRYNFEKTIRFVAFGGEEQGLVGSFDYVQDLQASGVDVAGSFNLDMISYRGNASPPFIFGTIADDNPNSQAMAYKIVEAAETFLPTVLSGFVSINPGAASSDHYAFWTMGWPATFTLQSYSYSYYHTVNDLVIYNQMDYATYITKACLAALADFAVPLGGSTEISGSVSGTWSLEGSPYCVIDSIWVPEDSTLSIEPGVLVLFRGHHKFKVLENATFRAVGTVNDPIIFTPFDPAEDWHGIRFYSASNSSRMEYCHVKCGSATGPGEDAYGGGILCSDSSPTIAHCLITDCTADQGGAIYCSDYSHPILTSCTISDNSANDGGAIYCDNSDPTLKNCILWGNAPQEIALSGISNPEATYCDIAGGWAGEGNIDTDPLFANPNIGDYHLQSTVGRCFYGLWMSDSLYSPCIDAGDPALAYSNEPEPNGDLINMGAFGNTEQASLSINDPHYAFGQVSGTWTLSNSPIYVFGEIYIPENETLVIEPGVQVIFLGHYKFEILENATLRAIGTAQDSITFSAAESSEGWFGIRFYSASDSSRLEYCHLADGIATGSGGDDAYGGAIFCYNCSPTLRYCLIENSHAIDGGGIYVSNSSAQIIGCDIRANFATSGGGIYSYESTPTSSNNIISGNSANNGAGMTFQSSEGDVSNNIISQNSANGFGGGIYLFNAAPTFENNTISENAANHGGGTCSVGNVVAMLTNCIIWDNQAEQIYIGGGLAPQVTYSDVQGGWEGEGNIDEDPLFESGPLSDYHLAPGSPCVDGGNPGASFNDPEDPANPGYALWPAQGTVVNDMGAYGGGGANHWVGVPEEVDTHRPTAFTLQQNFPNPFNPTTTITYTMPEASRVNLIVYDISGRLVITLVNGWLKAGIHDVVFDGSKLASGIYIYRMKAGKYSASGKMVLMK